MNKRTQTLTPEAQWVDDRLQMGLLAAEVCVSATEAALEATHKLWAAEDEIRRLLVSQADELPAICAPILDLQEFVLQTALSWEAALSAGTVAVGWLAPEGVAPVRD